MATIVTRAGKGSPLTITEVDSNFTGLNTDKAELSGAAFTGAITTNSTVDGRDVAADGTKLDGIEASADITTASKIQTAGGLLDSELTDIASVKALDQGVATTDSPTFAAATVTGEITANGGIALGEGDAATFGNSDELSIKHAGGSTYLTNTTGSLILRTDAFRVLNTANSEQILHGDANGAVTAYYDNAIKLATTSTGIDVTGTATADKVTLGTSSASNGKLTLEGVDGADSAGIYFNNTTATNGKSYSLSSGNSGEFMLYDRTSDAYRLFVNASGNVGIGTSSPATTLHITKDGNQSAVLDAYEAQQVSHNTIAYTRWVQNTLGIANIMGVDSAAGILGTSSNHALAIRTNNTARFNIAADGSLSTPTAGTSNVRFGVNAGNSIVSGGNYNVLVGDEAGTAITTGQQNVLMGFETGDALTEGTRNLAYGTGALTADTKGSMSTALGHYALAAQNFTSATNTYNVAVGHNAGASVTTGQYNTLIGGLAGDGATTADYSTALGYGALGGVMTGEGNVALGVNTLLVATTAHSNTAVGTSSMASVTTGTNNVAVGRNSLDANTTASNNTAVGYASLGANTTGSGNVAMGYQSADANTTGTNHTALGYNALSGNTTGNSNVAVGYSALEASTTASNNTAVGALALGANTTGTNNVAVGKDSLDSNTTGSNNTAVGVDTLQANTTAADNTAFGHGALAVTTGTSNTGVGKYALVANTTGTYNVAVGSSSLASCTTGGYNIGIGHAAGAWTTGIVTGGFNIHLGYATNPATTSTQNELVIATGNNGATGKGTNTGWFDNLTSGIYQATNSASWATTSDERLKKNIVDNNTGLSILNQLQIKNFEHRLESEITELPSEQRIKGEGIQIGVIAQEIQQILPECVTELETGVLTVDTSNLTWYLINAIKELSAQVDALTARITTLEG